MEINVAVPVRTGRIGAAPRKGALGVIVPTVWLPRRTEAPGCVRAGRSWLLQPICPAGQGVGSSKLWCPSGLPGPYPLKWPFYSCPWPCRAESRFRPLTLQFFLSTSVTQGLGCPVCSRKSGQTGLEGANLPPELPCGDPEALGSWSLSFCVMLQQSDDEGWGGIYFACPYLLGHLSIYFCPAGAIRPGWEGHFPETACFPRDCTPSPSWCLALNPAPAYDSFLQRDATGGSSRDYRS